MKIVNLKKCESKAFLPLELAGIEFPPFFRETSLICSIQIEESLKAKAFLWSHSHLNITNAQICIAFWISQFLYHQYEKKSALNDVLQL